MADWYISPTGNDTTGDGSSGNPYLTVQKAHDVASAADTIYCQDGTYTMVTTTFTKQLTIKAVNIKLAVFDGAGAAVTWGSISHDTIISGLRFQDMTNVSTVTGLLSSSRRVTLENCYFGPDIIVISTDERGGILSGGTGATTPFIVNNCTFDQVVNSSGFACFLARNLTLTLTNCIFYKNTSGATVMGWNNSGTGTIKNNIVSSDGAAIQFNKSADAGTFTSSYNCWNNVTNKNTGTGDVNADPLFVDPANGNFNLRTSPIVSPVIDAGDLA